MKVIVGLGNPGIKYVNNRHNIGFVVVDELQTEISKSQIPNSKQIKIFKSKNFMNSSGSFVLNLTKTYNLLPNDLFIIHDDLDIPLGSFKIQFGKGPKVHNGLNDIYEKIGTSEFWHVRVGVDNRHSEIAESISRGPVRGLKNTLTGREYVLEDFTNEEKIILEKVIKQICNQLIQ